MVLGKVIQRGLEQESENMSNFSSDELEAIFELASLKESAVKSHKEELNPDFIEADILKAAREMGISETAIRDAIQQVPLWKRLKRLRTSAKILRSIGLSALLATSSLGLGWLVLPAGMLFASLWPTISTFVFAGLVGSLYREAYRQTVELERDLALDDGDQISEELASILDRYYYRKQHIATMRKHRHNGFIESDTDLISSIFSGLSYLVAPPKPAIVRYELKREREHRRY